MQPLNRVFDGSEVPKVRTLLKGLKHPSRGNNGVKCRDDVITRLHGGRNPERAIGGLITALTGMRRNGIISKPNETKFAKMD